MGEKKLWIGKLRVEVGEWRTGVCGLRKTGLQAGIEVKNVVICFLTANYFQTLYFRSKARASTLNVCFTAK